MNLLRWIEFLGALEYKWCDFTSLLASKVLANTTHSIENLFSDDNFPISFHEISFPGGLHESCLNYDTCICECILVLAYRGTGIFSLLWTTWESPMFAIGAGQNSLSIWKNLDCIRWCRCENHAKAGVDKFGGTFIWNKVGVTHWIRSNNRCIQFGTETRSSLLRVLPGSTDPYRWREKGIASTSPVE